jgi:hypothetical protein
MDGEKAPLKPTPEDIEEGFRTDDEKESHPSPRDQAVVDASSMLDSSMEARQQKEGEMLRLLNLSHRTEVAYISALIQNSSKEGHTAFNYTHNAWSEWFKTHTSGDPIKEFSMLHGLEKYLQRKGYETAVTRPYRVDAGEKYFLHIKWTNSHRFDLLETLDCTYNRMLNVFFLFLCLVCAILTFFIIAVFTVHHVFRS